MFMKMDNYAYWKDNIEKLLPWNYFFPIGFKYNPSMFEVKNTLDMLSEYLGDSPYYGVRGNKHIHALFYIEGLDLTDDELGVFPVPLYDCKIRRVYVEDRYNKISYMLSKKNFDGYLNNLITNTRKGEDDKWN